MAPEAQMAGLSVKEVRIEAKDGYYLGTSPDGKQITGRGTRYYTDGFPNPNRSEGTFCDDKQNGFGNLPPPPPERIAPPLSSLPSFPTSE